MSIINRLVSLVSRRTLRAEGHVFAITPERFAIAEGIHASLAMTPTLFAAVFFDRPEIAFGASRHSGIVFAIRKDQIPGG